MLGLRVPNFKYEHIIVYHHQKNMPWHFLSLYLSVSKWWADDGLRITEVKHAKIWQALNFPKKCNHIYKTRIFVEKRNYITYYLHTSKLLFKDFTIWQPDLNLQRVVECFIVGIQAKLLAYFLIYVHSHLDYQLFGH